MRGDGDLLEVNFDLRKITINNNNSTCKRDLEICCKKSTNNKCEDDPNYHCIPPQDCIGEEDKAENLVVTQFDIRQEGLKITNINDNLTCEQGLNVCCKKKATPAKNPTERPKLLDCPDNRCSQITKEPPKCGQHNPDGLEIRAKNPSDDGNVAFDR